MGSSALLQGIYVTIIGMGLVFLSLGILLLAMIALERFFRPEETGVVGPPQKEINKMGKEKVAAIAVAIASALAERESVRVEEAEPGAGLRERTSALAEEEGVRAEEVGLGAGLREKTSPWALLSRRGWMR